MLPTTFETLPNGHSLRMARLGGGPPVVLLHGYPDNLQIWCELAPWLAKRHEVIAFDWPGMGYSDAWPGGATPAHMADRLLALLDAWQVGRVALVGMDMGGQPALSFAARHPLRVSHLVVMNSLVFGDERTSWEIAFLRRFGFNRFVLRRLPGVVFRRAETTFLPRGVRLPDSLRADLWESFRRNEVRAFVSKMCVGYQGTLARLPELYGQIACPTLVLWGRRDKHFPPSQATRLHAAIAHSTLHVVGDGEHWMAWHGAAEVAERLNEFLA
ncbi:MAG TPA: alpha/beta hydrolase [Pirellulales bacterium]|jgi:pimeloyl-ACP methyl ester carboxylesterase|nr:alpha/beta hydrolase [Pirellulales bacterium]